MAKPLYRLGMEALAAYLETQLDGVAVETSWPDPEAELRGKRVTIIRAGAESRVEFIWSGVPSESREVDGSESGGLIREYRYDLDCIVQRLQLDMWAESEPDLEDIEEQLGTALRQGPAVTLGTGNRGPFRDGPLLAVADGFADFTLIDGPDLDHSADHHMRREWRSSISLEMTMRLTVWAASPRQAEIIFRARVGAIPPKAPVTTATSTADGVTIEETP